jgi:hypothetical protein
MVIGLLALAIDLGRSRSFTLAVAVTCGAAFLIAGLWPYYPFFQLIFNNKSHVNADHVAFYPGLVHLLLMVILCLVGLPLLWLRFRNNRRDFLALGFICSVAIYLLGGLTGTLLLGRILPLAALMLQLSTADWFARSRTDHSASWRAGNMLWMRHLIIASAACGVLTMLPGLISAIPIFQNSYGEYAFLSDNVPQYESVLTDLNTSLKVPVFGGKVVAFSPGHTLFFVNCASREKDATRFFWEIADALDREEIVRKYQVKFIVVNKRSVAYWPDVLRSVHSLSSIQYADGDMVLLRIRNHV